MPWKGQKDPYKIWISEIILQQTRVEQGTAYYYKLIEKYPTIADLASANEQELFSIWQGLGYYSRCRNLLASAKNIVENHNGIFPKNFEEIIKLKGIGDYTAAAIASFAFNLPHAVVDGNVVRVLSRIFAISESYFSSNGKKYFLKFANDLIDKIEPSKYNQAIMDFGATICKPQNPLCNQCPFIDSCKAYELNKISYYPIKKEKLTLKIRFFHFLVIEDTNYFYILQRNEKDIWQNLYSFYLIESENENLIIENEFDNLIKHEIGEPQFFTQILSHQKIMGYFYSLDSVLFDEIFLFSLLKIEKKQLNQFAFPKMIISFFQKNNYL